MSQREPKTDQELRELALGIEARTIFTDRHIPEDQRAHMLKNVFLPLALLSPEHKEELLKEDIALVYEHMKDAGPRSTNGFPNFFSMRFLTAAETEKVMGYIEELRQFKEAKTA